MMKLGTQTGSLVNHLLSRAVIGQPTPTVGMGATILSWTDRHAATIRDVWTVGKWTYVSVVQDIAKVVSGSTHNGTAQYEYSPGHGATMTWRSSGGAWEGVIWNSSTKRWNKSTGQGLRIGERSEYRDPSF